MARMGYVYGNLMVNLRYKNNKLFERAVSIVEDVFVLAGIVAIMPPGGFSQAIWDALVKQGKLKYAGHGTYELAEQTE